MNNTISLNTWEGPNDGYDNFVGMGNSQRRYGRVARRAVALRTLRRHYAGMETLAEREARRVMWGGRIAALAPFVAALLLASAGLWLLRGHDEGADRAALKREQGHALQLRGGVR